MYEEEEVPEEEAVKLSKDLNGIYQATSAQEGTGIKEMFKLIGEKLIHPDNLLNYNLPPESKVKEKKQKNILLKKTTKRIKKGCC